MPAPRSEENHAEAGASQWQERQACSTGARTAQDQYPDRHARHSRPRRAGSAARRLFHCRCRRPCHRDGILVGNRRSHGQRRLPADGERVQGSRRLAARSPQCHARHVVPGRVRPYPASAAAGGIRSRRTHPCAGDAGAARHGFDGHRLHGRIPDADAGARHAPTGGHGSRDRECVQPLARRRDHAAGRAHQGDALSAVQSSRGVRQSRRAICRQSLGHRLHGYLDPVPAGAPRQLHAALFRDPGDAASRSAFIPASTGATSRCSNAINSFPCTRSRSCTSIWCI